jgi:SAM-dependent methyltransferase
MPSSPRQRRRELQALYDATRTLPAGQSDPWTAAYLHHYRGRYLLLADAVERHLRGPRRRVADVGCHNGFFLRFASHLGFSEFVGVDYFPLPPERSFLTGLPGARFVQTNFNETRALRAIDDRSVDCVVSTEVFEHLFQQPAEHLQDCWRIVRPGGLLLLTTPNPATLANAVRLVRGRPMSWGGVAFAETPKLTPQGLPAAMWDVHFREYAAAELRKIIVKLDEVEIVDHGFVSTQPAPTDRPHKRLAKRLQWSIGLGHWRPLATTQFWVLRRRRDRVAPPVPVL